MPQQQNGYDCGLYVIAEIQWQEQKIGHHERGKPERDNLYKLLMSDSDTMVYEIKKSEQPRKAQRTNNRGKTIQSQDTKKNSKTKTSHKSRKTRNIKETT